MSKKVSHAVVKRLPRYYRYLESLQSAGVTKVSSGKLAEMLDITASQVRQDFCNFGGFGQQGYGYDVNKLMKELANIMGLDKTHNMVIIGAGNIGRALTGYNGFVEEGFLVKAIFDIKVDMEEINGIPLYHMEKLEDYLTDNDIDIAVIATQAGAALEVADKVIKCGVINIWNFAPIDLEVPKNVTVENISMSESLFVLSYRIEKKKKKMESQKFNK